MKCEDPQLALRVSKIGAGIGVLKIALGSLAVLGRANETQQVQECF